jgi:hypothetical protein
MKTMTDWIICGRAIGRASGWDQSDTFSFMLYDFEPAVGFNGPSGDVLFDVVNGTIESFNDDGTVKLSCDLIDAIKDLQVARQEGTPQ